MFVMENIIWCWALYQTLKWQKHNINTQGIEQDLPLMFGLKNEFEHLYKNQSLEIQNTSLVIGVCRSC